MKSLSHYVSGFFSNMDSYDSQDNEMECFKKYFIKFCNSGKKEDAFSVYYCYSEIFHIFGKGYDNTKKLLEILSDYENHAGVLLDKHRDHYSHSVYVFAIGLAIYDNSKDFRHAFDCFYNVGSGYRLFLYFWGLTALFHDIGYPFEIAHDEIKTYTKDIWGDDSRVPFVSYANFDRFIRINEDDCAALRDLSHSEELFYDMNKLLSFWLHLRLGYNRSAVEKKLEQEQASSKFQDHAYFSAILLLRFILDNHIDMISVGFMDAVSAILLHNSLNRFNMDGFSRRIDMYEFPLAYLLVLADNLQDWDRQAYGRKTKKDPQAWAADFSFDWKGIYACYYFNSFFISIPGSADELRKNSRVEKICSGQFVEEIEGMICHGLLLNAVCEEKVKDLHTQIYASSYSFINLCDFAKAIHANYVEKCNSMNVDFLNKTFGELALEEKLSNIEQAKSYSKKLELINCFFSDKELDYPIVMHFEEKASHVDEIEFLAREEHVRWVKEKLNLGWTYGTGYINPVSGKEDKILRNRIKQHKDMLPYDLLDEETKEKDRIMVRNMIPFLYKHGNGIKIYRYRYGVKPTLDIVAVGHRKIIGDIDNIKKQIKDILIAYDKEYFVVVRSSFSPGADQLVMECAMELGLTTKANIPLFVRLDENEDMRNYVIARKNIGAYMNYLHIDAESNGYVFSDMDERRMLELLSQTAVCHINKDEQYTWQGAAKYMVNRCDKMIALWDGVETMLESSKGRPTNRGGTYHCICMAKEKGLIEGKDIHIIPVER